jgi:hypothetical protein
VPREKKPEAYEALGAATEEIESEQSARVTENLVREPICTVERRTGEL